MSETELMRLIHVEYDIPEEDLSIYNLDQFDYFDRPVHPSIRG